LRKSREIGKRGSFTTFRTVNPDKEADATFGFGPLRSAPFPFRRNPPLGLSIGEWVTLAAEFAVFQSWEILENAALWWASYPGIQYVVCINNVSPKAKRWEYRLYSFNRIDIRHILQLDELFSGQIDENTHTLTFDAHPILDIPVTQPFPAGINVQIVVDLFYVCKYQTDNLNCIFLQYSSHCTNKIVIPP
jgi:hypothetical protein